MMLSFQEIHQPALRVGVSTIGLVYLYKSIYNSRVQYDMYIDYIYFYCMKPPNIKAPKCTLFSIQYFIIQGQRSQALAGLATAHCEHRWGQLTLESPFRIVESG